MQSKLQELTEKIYQEGVVKGNADASQIVDYANIEAVKIVENAKKEAEAILTNARKKAEETRTNTESEIKLSAKQSLNALKQQITDVINGKIIDPSIKETLEDKDFIKKIIESTLTNWSSSGQKMDLAIILPATDEKSLGDYFQKSVKTYIDKGVEIRFDSTLKAGFQLGPKDGNYKVSFSDEDFINFFKQYLRPKLVEILFSEQ